MAIAGAHGLTKLIFWFLTLLAGGAAWPLAAQTHFCPATAAYTSRDALKGPINDEALLPRHAEELQEH